MSVAPNGSETPPAGSPILGLVIVARDHPELYQALQHAFRDSPQLLVLLDRRREDRRRHTLPVPVDRRRFERRSRPSVEENLSLRQYILARPLARRPKNWRLTPDR